MLNAIYEEDFLGFSYGSRAGRGTHDATWMRSLFDWIESTKVNWILDADIRSFFDEIAASNGWFASCGTSDRRPDASSA